MLDPGRLIPDSDALAQARQKETEYDWITAASIYEKLFSDQTKTLDPLKTVKILQQLARSYFKAAFQAETRDEFKKRMKQAGLAYENLGRTYDSQGAETWSNVSEARRLFTIYWVSDETEERRRIVEKIVPLAEKCAQEFEQQKDAPGLLESRQDLLVYYDELQWLLPNLEALKDLLEKTLATGEYVTSQLRMLQDDNQLLESLFRFINLINGLGLSTILEGPSRDVLIEKTARLAGEISDVSKRIGTPYALCTSDLANCLAAWLCSLDFPQKNAGIWPRALRTAEQLKDCYLKAWLSETAAFGLSFLWDIQDSREDEEELFKKAIELSGNAIRDGEIPLLGPLLDLSFYTHAWATKGLAVHVETDRDVKRRMFERAVEISRQGMKYTSYNQARCTAHALSCDLYYLATITEDSEEKDSLLKESLSLREEVHHAGELAFPAGFWNHGRDHGAAGRIKEELSKVERDPAKKIGLLTEAVSDMQECIRICMNPIHDALARDNAEFQEAYGDILVQLYHLTPQTRFVKDAIENYTGAIANIRKLPIVRPIPPLKWKIAKAYDLIDDHAEASKAFRESANDYRIIAKNISASGSSLAEIAVYLDAWSFIEEARGYHNQEQYSLSANRYAEVVKLLEHTVSWSYLAQHYQACSLFEEGQQLGRNDRQEAAIASLTKSHRTFQETVAKLEEKLGTNSNPEEKQEVKDWIDVAREREKSCLGGIALEEAKLLDKTGEDLASADKYSSASKIFNALLNETSNENTRKESQVLSLFSDAWAKMKIAERETSPEKYQEAAESFRKAATIATKANSHLLALANASICDALETGMRFHLTRDIKLYSDIKKHLETAASQYERGGFESATEWTRATQRLFDALVYVTDAETEREPQKKSELYHYAEKYLDMSAKLYGVAGYQAKKNEVDKLLKRVHEDKQLLLSPIDALKENPAVTRAIVTPIPLTHDEATGLERFEPARVVGSITLQPKEGDVDADFVVNLEMVNIGRGPATLVKVENLTPDGLKMESGASGDEIDEGSLDLHGKRLNYLRTHQEKVRLKARGPGKPEVRLRVLFVDETGEYRSYDFQNLSLTVTESVPALASTSSPIMTFLSKAFVDDYMVRKLAIEHAGWRSLMDVVESLKIPKAQLYGDSRYGHTFGKPLDDLVKAGIVEYRITPGARGRGGNVMKIRAAYEREPVKKLVDELALKPLRHGQIPATV